MTFLAREESFHRGKFFWLGTGTLCLLVWAFALYLTWTNPSHLLLQVLNSIWIVISICLVGVIAFLDYRYSQQRYLTYLEQINMKGKEKKFTPGVV